MIRDSFGLPVSDVREIPAGQTHLAARALTALRPRWNDEEAVTEVIDTRLRPGGYRVIGVPPGPNREAVAAEARRSGCEGLHLDSGVGADRAPAHRLYVRHELRISAHHFERDL